MDKSAENIVSRFYNEGGWEETDGVTEDARQFEDLREVAKEYVSRCRLRVLRHIPQTGENVLDMASGPIQYREYLEFSRNFNKRYCVDLSSSALAQAKKRISEHGVFLHGSFFDIQFERDFFDCSISLHTIYHIDKTKQEEAVRKLIDVTKPGHPVIIVYSNPHTVLSLLKMPFRMLRKIKMTSDQKSEANKLGRLYFFAYPHKWWKRFSDIATIEIYPWRSFYAREQKLLFPNNSIGKKMFEVLFSMEEIFPKFFVGFSEYPMIVLTKK
jgi:ubiquinone/menaquinone biosynthesis C-methylase UbiE